MNAKFLLSVLVAFSVSANICAIEPEAMKIEKETEFGKQIEYTMAANGLGTWNKRSISKLDHNGNLFEKTMYEWVAFEGWQPIKKLEYKYTVDNVLTEVTYTKWDNRRKAWSSEIHTARYDVAETGNVYVTEVIKK